MCRAEVRGRKRRRIQEEEELVTSSIVQVAIKVLPPLVVFHTKLLDYLLGKPSCKKSAVFLNIVQKAFGPPPPLLFEHLSYFAGGVF